MKITKKRVLNIDPYLSKIVTSSTFKIVAEITPDKYKRLQQLGFTFPFQTGDTLLPKPIGPVSRFNAEGMWQPLRNLPKEPRYIRTVQWTWKQWTGGGGFEEHTEFRDIHRDCYPRAFTPPPSLSLTYTNIGDRELVVSTGLINENSVKTLNKHAINLFLELFGTCEIVTTNLKSFDPPDVRYANWQLLPPGDHPWDRIESHIRRRLRSKSDGTRAVILDRQTTLYQYGPSVVYQGIGGFDDYLAYVFEAEKIVILESIQKGNAIYVFGLDWERLAKLSKGEIIADNLHLHRIVHTVGWKDRLKMVLKPTTPVQKPTVE